PNRDRRVRSRETLTGERQRKRGGEPSASWATARSGHVHLTTHAQPTWLARLPTPPHSPPTPRPVKCSSLTAALIAARRGESSIRRGIIGRAAAAACW